MNKSILIGRITKDPELRTTPNNRSVCQFTIAVNRTYTNEEGKREADFINCVVWDKQAENLAMYQKKGNQIAVEGRIQTRNYDDNSGKKVYVTEVLANNVSYLDTKKDDSNFNNLEEPPVQAGPMTGEQVDEVPIENDPFAAFGDSIEVNMELPF